MYSPEAEALRATLRDVFGWRHVDAGGGWLIFALPPAELGVHPSDGATDQELWLMCDDIQGTIAELAEKGIEVRAEPEEQDFGVVARLGLPGDVELHLYEPRHATPLGV